MFLLNSFVSLYVLCFKRDLRILDFNNKREANGLIYNQYALNRPRLYSQIITINGKRKPEFHK